MTPKGERTRQHLIDTAMPLFERDGFGQTPMRTIASEAGVSLGLAYRYFPAKEALILAFYEQIARRLAEEPVGGSTLGARFAGVMRAKLALLAGHRRAMGSMLAAMLDADGPIGILSPATAEIRATNRAILRAALEGVAPAELLDALTRLAWLGQALLLLAWVQRPDAAEALLGAVESALDRLGPLLALAPVAAAVRSAADALAKFESDEVSSTSAGSAASDPAG